MTALKNAQILSAPFPNQSVIQRARYSFADDGGATGVLTAFTAQGKVVIEDVQFHVNTTLTSGGSATLSCGPSTDSDLYLDSIAVASMAANYVAAPLLVEGTPNTKVVPAYMADGATIVFGIEAAALTAGIVDIIVKFSAF